MAQWPLPFGQAENACFRLPIKYQYGETPKGNTPREVPPNVHFAEADLSTDQFQDLADVVGQIQSAAAGHGVRFTVRIEIGNGAPLPQTVIEQVAALLTDISDDLVLK